MLYTDDIVLTAPNVNELQELIRDGTKSGA